MPRYTNLTRLSLALVAALGAAACPLFPTMSPVRCADDASCPSNASCIDGLCRFTDAGPGADADSGVEGGTPDAVCDPGAWWNCAWGARLKLTFDNGQQAEDLVDFPVLVHLTPGRVALDEFQPGGADVRFVDADHLTELSYEIERWDDGAEAWLWVKVPRIDAGSTTDHIWLYHANPAAGSLAQASAVWSADYRGVWHLDGAAVSSRPLPGADISHLERGTWSQQLIAGGLQLDGVDDRLLITAQDAVLGTLTDLTVSAWVRQDALRNQWAGVVSARFHEEDDYTAENFVLQTQGATFDFENNRPFPNTFEADLYTPRAWHLLAMVIDTSAEVGVLYLDGRPVNTVWDASNTPTMHDQDELRLGARWYHGGEKSYLEGGMDEVRIAAAARSADWMRAQYLSQADAFIDYDDGRWRDPDSPLRARLNLNAGELEQSLGGFPLLVTLDLNDSSRGWGQHDGDDLRFVDADGSLLPYEIDVWTPSGQAKIWVRLPQLNAYSAMDHLWLYYGDPASSVVHVEGAVWAPGHVGVWHLDPSLEDSSTSNLNGVDHGSVDTPGLVGAGRDFDDSSDNRVEIPYTSSLDDIQEELTVSAWVLKQQSLPGWRLAIAKEVGADQYNSYFLGFLDEHYVFGTATAGGCEYLEIVGTPTPVGVWQHLAGTHDGRQVRLYVDGVELGASVCNGTILSDEAPVFLGADTNDQGLSWTGLLDGLVDEVRLQPVVRSPAWLWAEHRSVIGGLIDLGPEEHAPAN